MNDNCLAGYRCPKCGSEGPFDIETEDLTEWSDEGTMYQFEPSFKEDGVWVCKSCRFNGKEDDFRRGFIDHLANSITKKNRDDALPYLDEMVHDLKSQEASDINNGGAAAQLAFIVESLGPLRTLDALRSEGLVSENTNEE